MWEATCPGDVATLTTTQKDTIQAGIATSAGVATEYVEVQYLPGSIKIISIIAVPDGATAASVQSSVITNLGTATAATSAIGLPVATVDAISTKTSSAASNTVVAAGGEAFVNQWNKALNKAVGLATTILIVIIVVPTVVVLGLIALIIYCCCCRKKMQVKVASAA